MMNDLTQIIIVFAIFLVSVVIALAVAFTNCSYEDSYLSVMLGMFVAIMFFVLSNDMVDKNFNAIPYNDTPETEYQLATNDNIPIYQTGSEGSITFFTQDGSFVTMNYDEMKLAYEDVTTPILQVYGRDDGGREWFGHTEKKKIIIILSEEYDRA